MQVAAVAPKLTILKGRLNQRRGAQPKRVAVHSVCEYDMERCFVFAHVQSLPRFDITGRSQGTFRGLLQRDVEIRIRIVFPNRVASKLRKIEEWNNC